MGASTFEITYAEDLAAPAAGEVVGGASGRYRIHGPHIIDVGFDSMRLVFDVVVIGTSLSEGDDSLVALSEKLEAAFSKRDRSLRIEVGGVQRDFLFGTTLLDPVAEIAKSGSRETDRGVARAYTISISAGLPVTDRSDQIGLKELEVAIEETPSGQRHVTMRGIYTAAEGRLARAQLNDPDSGFAPVAAGILGGIDPEATFERQEHQAFPSRNDSECGFSWSWTELLASQDGITLDSDQIVAHDIFFTSEASHPGDSAADLSRQRRATATFTAHVKKGNSLREIVDGVVLPYLKQLFQDTYQPAEFAVEHVSEGGNPTRSLLTAAVTFVYYTGDVGGVLEITETAAIEETRHIDYTPLHARNGYVAHAELGFDTKLRISTRVVVVNGAKKPRERLSGTGVRPGWNIIRNVSQTQLRRVGDPAHGEQLIQSIYTETMTERYHIKPGAVAPPKKSSQAESPGAGVKGSDGEGLGGVE